MAAIWHQWSSANFCGFVSRELQRGRPRTGNDDWFLKELLQSSIPYFPNCMALFHWAFELWSCKPKLLSLIFLGWWPIEGLNVLVLNPLVQCLSWIYNIDFHRMLWIWDLHKLEKKWNTEGPLLTLFFETLEKQLCKRRSDIVLNYQNKPCYLENRVVREPCKQRTACTLVAC